MKSIVIVKGEYYLKLCNIFDGEFVFLRNTEFSSFLEKFPDEK